MTIQFNRSDLDCISSQVLLYFALDKEKATAFGDQK